jgi:hypothetical protein
MYPDQPVPQPSGSLVPPPIHPPTAVATATPEPERHPRPMIRAEMHDAPLLLRMLGRAATVVLDALDEAGDEVARRIGLRSAGQTP